MNKENILALIADWQNQILKTEGIDRGYGDEILGAMGSKPIKIITGFRRSGKSFLVKKVAKKLVESKKYKLNNIFYLNFENINLEKINSAQALDELFCLFKMKMASEEGTKLLILDEVQKVKDWDKYVRTWYEKNTGVGKENEYEFILTGSNSELLSAELGSNLAGRFIEFFVQPFSFKELLLLKNIDVQNEIEYFRHQEEIKKLFYEYMKYGSLPEVFSISDEKAKYSYIEGIVSKVILDDVIKRFNVKNPALIEKIVNYLSVNTGNITSYSNIKNYANELGIDVEQETILNYINYLSKTFMIFDVQKLEWKSKRVFNTSRKYYSVDLGIVNHFSSLQANYFSAKQLENIVYLELKRRQRTHNIYYGYDQSNKKEIDFISQDRYKDTLTKYQITHELNSKNTKRELDSFLIANKYLQQGDNILLTLNDSEDKVIEHDNVKIHSKSLIKWLLK